MPCGYFNLIALIVRLNPINSLHFPSVELFQWLCLCLNILFSLEVDDNFWTRGTAVLTKILADLFQGEAETLAERARKLPHLVQFEDGPILSSFFRIFHILAHSLICFPFYKSDFVHSSSLSKYYLHHITLPHIALSYFMYASNSQSIFLSECRSLCSACHGCMPQVEWLWLSLRWCLMSSHSIKNHDVSRYPIL